MKKILNLIVQKMGNPKYFWPLIILVYILSRLATWSYPFDSDHWIFYYVGKIWAQGGTLYVSAWDHKPPLIFLYNALIHLSFGGSIVWHRILFTVMSIVDVALFWQLAKQVIPSFKLKQNDLAIKVSLLLYVFWRNLSQFTSSGNNTENVGLVFFLGMLLSYLSYRKDQKWWRMFVSGACFSVLFFLKGNFLLLGVPIGILFLVDNWKNLKIFFGHGLIFVSPLLLQAGYWAYYFNNKGAFEDFFIASFQFSAKYAKSAWSGDVSNNIVLILTLLIFLLPLLMFFIIYLKDVKKGFNNHDYLLVGLLFISGLGLTIGVGSFYPYYFLIFMPISVLILAYGLFNIQGFNIYIKSFFVLSLVGSILLSYGVSMKQFYNSFGGSVREEAREYRKIADYVKSNTTEDEKVFAYDYGATFYRLAERDSGSRFVSASVLLMENRDNFGFGFDQKFIDDMEASKAKYVVVYRDKESLYYQNKPLVEYFNSNYVFDRAFNKFEVLKRK